MIIVFMKVGKSSGISFPQAVRANQIQLQDLNSTKIYTSISIKQMIVDLKVEKYRNVSFYLVFIQFQNSHTQLHNYINLDTNTKKTGSCLIKASYK